MADPTSAPTVTENEPPSAYGGGALGGFMSIMGPRIKAKQQEELNTRAMQRDLKWQQMNDPAWSVTPGDETRPSPKDGYPNLKSYKEAAHKSLTDEYLKLAPTEAKGLLQKAIPFIQHLRGHKVDGQEGGAGAMPNGEVLGLPASATQNGMPQPPQPPVPPPPTMQGASAATPAVPPPPTGADVASTIQQHNLTLEAETKRRDLEAQTTGPIAARVKMFKDHPEYLSDPVTASMILGHPLPGIGRTLGSGTITAKEARSMGYDVDDSVPDDQYLKVTSNMLGTTLTPTDAVPTGHALSADGKPITQVQASIDKEARAMSYWHTKDAIQFQHRMALQGSSLQNALAKSDYTGARKIVNDSKVSLQNAINRTATMDKNLAAAEQGDQQAMVSLAGNHVLMITGAGDKGQIRATKLIWEDAVNSAPWLARISAKFDKDGYLSGVTLTPDQMQQMVRLAHEKVDTIKDSTQALGQTFATELAARRGNNVPPPPTAPATAAPAPAPAANSKRRVIDMSH